MSAYRHIFSERTLCPPLLGGKILTFDGKKRSDGRDIDSFRNMSM